MPCWLEDSKDLINGQTHASHCRSEYKHSALVSSRGHARTRHRRPLRMAGVDKSAQAAACARGTAWGAGCNDLSFATIVKWTRK